MRNFKKYGAIALASMLVISSLSGCSGAGKETKNKGGAKNIEIGYWNSGLGTDWLDKMIAAFEKEYPEYKVTYNATASDTAAVGAFGLEEADTTDLYLVSAEYDNEHIISLDDVLDSTPKGEDKAIREKFIASYLEKEKTEDGTIRNLTYGGGALGFVYNTKLFEKAGIDTLPRTTDELVKVFDKLYSNGITPTCHFQGADYMSYLAAAWRTQYDGEDYYINNFFACKDKNGNSPSKEVFTKEDGRLEVLKVFEKIITPDYVLSGSNTHHITTMQTKFIQGECATMFTGAWVANEMKTVGKMDDFTVMKTPVISAITDKLTTVTKEKDLRTVISAVDAVTDGEKSEADYKVGNNYVVDGLQVSATDWEIIRKARNTTPTNYVGESLFIPSYSDAQEGAKKFVTFLYSDEGYKIYTDTLHLTLPLVAEGNKVDTEGWNTFEKTMYDITQKTEQFADRTVKKQHKIFHLGGASEYSGLNIGDFCANNVTDRINATTAWEKLQKEVEAKYEKTWLANIK